MGERRVDDIQSQTALEPDMENGRKSFYGKAEVVRHSALKLGDGVVQHGNFETLLSYGTEIAHYNLDNGKIAMETNYIHSPTTGSHLNVFLRNHGLDWNASSKNKYPTINEYAEEYKQNMRDVKTADKTVSDFAYSKDINPNNMSLKEFLKVANQAIAKEDKATKARTQSKGKTTQAKSTKTKSTNRNIR